MAERCTIELKDAVQCKESAAFPNFRRAASHRDPLLPLFPYLPLGSLPFLLSHTFSLFKLPLPARRFSSEWISLSAEIGFATWSSSVGGGWVWQWQAVSSTCQISNHQAAHPCTQSNQSTSLSTQLYLVLILFEAKT